MKRIAYTLAIILAGTGLGYSQPPPPSLWDHNGSVVMAIPELRQVLYSDPRPEMAMIGVQPGTLLYQGDEEDERYGVIYSFSRWCSNPFPYRVEVISRTNDKVVMEGPAPVINLETCSVLYYTMDRPNAHLVFTRIRPIQ